MKKIVRLTESDLSCIVKRVISEQNIDELDEGIFDSILKTFRGGGKKVVSAASKMSTTPLFNQISHDIRQLIIKIPQKVKVGVKLDGVFKKTLYDVKSVPFTVLIDQQGKIIKTNLRGEALESELQRIYGH